MRRNRMIRTIGIFLLLFVLTTAMYAFTATNTVDSSRAGIGDGDIDGYDVTNVSWTLDSDDPSQITGVAFDLNESAGSAYARVDAGTWATCVNSTGNSWTCAVSGDTEDAASLEVAAAD
jgi:hypothetical protein